MDDGQGWKTDDTKTGRGRIDQMMEGRTNDGRTRQTGGVHMVDGRSVIEGKLGHGRTGIRA